MKIQVHGELPMAMQGRLTMKIKDMLPMAIPY